MQFQSKELDIFSHKNDQCSGLNRVVILAGFEDEKNHSQILFEKLESFEYTFTSFIIYFSA